MKIRITGTGSALPDKILTNADLEKMVDTSDEWIRERTGIRQRHISEEDTVASLAVKAAEAALDMAGCRPEDVDLIIVATCTPELLLPCCACQVQAAIGATRAAAFDINAACSGFLFALQTARAYICSGLFENALIIGSEVISKVLDWTDRGTCVLFGDGAGAVFAQGCPDDEPGGIQDVLMGSDGTKGMVLSCATGNVPDVYHYVKMDGREVYRFATRTVPACIREVLDRNGMSCDDVDLYVLHQANLRIIESIAKQLRVPAQRFAVNLDRVGNMSSAAIPVLLDELNRGGALKAGQKIVLSGFGAGLTYGACLMQWQ